MFDSKEDALAHRDAVLEVLVDLSGIDTWQVHPVLDGAAVKVATEDHEQASEQIEEAGFPAKMIGEGPDGDWFEMKVRPKNDG